MSAPESQLITDNSQLWKRPEAEVRQPNPIVARIQAGQLVRIMGPCSLMSVEQLEAILEVIEGNVDGVRAPGKKPRTRPVSPQGERLFEGIGLREAKRVYRRIVLRHPQLLFASEVMSGKDLKALQQWLALPWIGSRTQEQETCRDIGKAAAEAQLPVMVKNPLVADLELMMGMIENTIIGAESAIPVMLCLRGTIPTEGTDTNVWRNKDNIDWIPALKRAFPNLPIILDPSHMLKKNALTPRNVVDLVKKGVDLGANGFIIELHTPKFPSITDPGTHAEETLDLLVRENLA
jgi:3-deoxy-D-arabino-heptulosonate 7-phosphate (DAHP) synthase